MFKFSNLVVLSLKLTTYLDDLLCGLVLNVLSLSDYFVEGDKVLYIDLVVGDVRVGVHHHVWVCSKGTYT